MEENWAERATVQVTEPLRCWAPGASPRSCPVRSCSVRPCREAAKATSQTGSTEIWTRIAGFRVQSANHYTMEPHDRFGGVMPTEPNTRKNFIQLVFLRIHNQNPCLVFLPCILQVLIPRKNSTFYFSYSTLKTMPIEKHCGVKFTEPFPQIIRSRGQIQTFNTHVHEVFTFAFSFCFPAFSPESLLAIFDVATMFHLNRQDRENLQVYATSFN